MRPLTRAIHEFTHAILNPYDLEDLLDRLIGHVTSVLDAEGAGIMLESREADLEFAAASSEAVKEIERYQDEVRSGACHEAFMTSRTVVVDDLRGDQRWPGYRDRALDAGFGSVIGVPMNANAETIGVLNVYRTATRPWSEEDVEACEILAAMGAGYILHVHQLRASQQLAEQLQRALDSRAVIERANGVLMERERVDAERAASLLREQARSDGRRLRDVAVEVVEERDAGGDSRQ